MAEQAYRCIKINDPLEKITFGEELFALWQNHQLDYKATQSYQINLPGRAESPLIVPVQKVAKRGFGSTKQIASLLHALAHIELTAVNLSWDAICRYPSMPQEYYHDWINTAHDEGQHFLLLRQLLKKMDYDYGDFPVHDELWQMAQLTAEDILARMGIVHRVLEARALDILPSAIKKFTDLNYANIVKALEKIANDEIRHVKAGTDWYRFCCQSKELDADSYFFKLIKEYMQQYPKGPFNLKARKSAGFNDNELELLQQYDAEYRQSIKNKVIWS